MKDNNQTLSRRRGPFRPGDRVQLTDAYGRMHTITLQEHGFFNVYKASFTHDLLIGQPEGITVTSREGKEFVAMRPLRTDYQLGMPRGATIAYPKDVGAIIQHADIFHGARVLEAGAGSGSLSIGLLEAVGPQGQLVSYEQRDDFADIAQANVDMYFGTPHPAWELIRAPFGQSIDEPDHSFDRVVLDMLDPWSHLDFIWKVLCPGGVLICYITTVTQMSRLAEDIKATGQFTPPYAWETIQRPWHLDGLAVRPEHSMVGHTGFLLIARTLSPEQTLPKKKPGVSKAHDDLPGQWDDEENWDISITGQRLLAKRKINKVRRESVAEANQWVRSQSSPHQDSSIDD